MILRRMILGTLVLLLAVGVVGCSGAADSSGDGLHKTAPDVTGIPQSEATAKIVDAGYEVGSVVEKASSSEPGTVVSQEPVAGTSLPRGGEINLVVAED